MRRFNHFLHSIMLVILFLVVPAVCWGQWTNWGQVNTDGFGNTNNFSAFSMAVYGNQLYVGTWNNSDGCEVWRRDGSGTGDWTQINTDGFGNSSNRGAHAMAVYNDRLYVGTANNTNGFEVWEYDGSSWTQVASGGLGDNGNTWASSMVVHDGKLYLGTSWQAGVFTYDGSAWTQINVNGFGDSDNQAVRSLAVYDGKVYAGVTTTPTMPTSIAMTARQRPTGRRLQAVVSAEILWNFAVSRLMTASFLSGAPDGVFPARSGNMTGLPLPAMTRAML